MITSGNKTVGLFNSKPVILNCQLLRKVYTLGTTIPVQCLVDNQSNKAMKLKASLYQVMIFQNYPKTKSSFLKLCRAVPSTVGSHIKNNYVLKIEVPANIQILQISCPNIN